MIRVFKSAFPLKLMRLAESSGFRVVLHSYVLKMIHKLTEDERLAIKTEWLETLRPFVHELWNLEMQKIKLGGFHFACLERRNGSK